MPKTWIEKYNSTKPFQVKIIDKKFADMPAGTKMFIATPKIVDEYIKEIPSGVDVEIKTMRNDLAAAYEAEMSCPVTTSIFVRIVSEVAYEAYQNGTDIDDITPFWRVVKPNSPLAKKLSCGSNFIQKQRELEHLS